jgi:hypothetical protein
MQQAASNGDSDVSFKLVNKSKADPVHTMVAQGGRGVIAPTDSWPRIRIVPTYLINTKAWSSRFGFGRGVDSPIL